MTTSTVNSTSTVEEKKPFLRKTFTGKEIPILIQKRWGFTNTVIHNKKSAEGGTTWQLN